MASSSVCRVVEASALVFPVGVPSATVLFLSFSHPFNLSNCLVSKEWVVEGVLALIFYSRPVCLRAISISASVPSWAIQVPVLTV